MTTALNPNNTDKNQLDLKSCRRWIGGAVAALGLLCLTTGVRAQDPVTMAPPVSEQSAPDSQYPQQSTEGTPVNASQSSVFNWAEIPQDQRVPVTRVAFDQGGYQIYDTVGETIVVPFANKNLYVMKFAVSPDDTMFFENTGGAPVLYVPQNGYLENATVPGAKWYPFSEKFHPAEPVFLGIAPSYPVFVGLGWYPHTALYGGYYCHTSFVEGGVFLPSIGLSFFIGGHPYYGYSGYRDYVFAHPAPYHIGYFNRDVYHFAGRPIGPDHAFYGGGHGGYDGHSFGGYRGGDRGPVGGFHGDHQAFGSGSRSFGDGAHTFRGAGTFNGGSHSYSGDRSYSSGHSFSGGGDPTRYAHRTFQGAGHSYSGGDTGGRSYSSGNVGGRSYGGGNAGGHSDGGSRSYSSGRSSSNDRSGGGSRSYSGGGHSDNGGSHSDGGGRSYGGGGRGR